MFECLFESFPVCMFKDLSGWRRNHDGVCGECKYHGEVIAESDIVYGDVVVSPSPLRLAAEYLLKLLNVLYRLKYKIYMKLVIFSSYNTNQLSNSY